MMNELEKLQKFGRNVAKYRKLRKLTQNQFAELLDISREHLAKIETAKRGISINLLFKMSEVLSISEKELFNFKQN
ncbi:MAG: helix-turn-helix transcriptional regulator [Candidatus Gastranaerophilales bacterium]|nr:helix-turn-helix transcriptional regulator [Candidatus Gastranaerophilales bacterium]